MWTINQPYFSLFHVEHFIIFYIVQIAKIIYFRGCDKNLTLNFAQILENFCPVIFIQLRSKIIYQDAAKKIAFSKHQLNLGKL